MKILFVYPNITKQEAISPAIAYLAGYIIKNSSHKVYLFDFTFNNLKNLLKFAEQLKPDIVAFTVQELDYTFDLSIAKKLKEIIKTKIIFGGVYPTSMPDKVIKNRYVDIICVGEGEKSLLQLLDKISKKEDYFSVKGMWLKKNGKVIKNKPAGLIKNLEDLYCYRELFNFETYLKNSGRLCDIYVGRGCPYSCSYCVNHVIKKIYGNKYLRLRKVESIIEEMSDLIDKYNISGFVFSQDCFTYNKKWLRQFCEAYKEKINKPFVCNSRISDLDKNTLRLFKNSGCVMVQVGIETGNEKLRKKILRRYETNEEIIKLFEFAHKIGIKIFSYNMVGIPEETKENIKETIELNRTIKPDELQCTIFYPFEGTDLWFFLSERGWIKKKKELLSYNYDIITDYPTLKPSIIKRERNNFAFNVFKSYNIKKALFYLLKDKFFYIYTKSRKMVPAKFKSWLFKNKFIKQNLKNEN